MNTDSEPKLFHQPSVATTKCYLCERWYMRFHNRNFFHKNADLYWGTITKSSSDGQTSGNEFIPSCPAPFSFTKYHSTFCNSIYVFFYYLIKLVANIVPSLKKELVNFKTVGSPSSLCPPIRFFRQWKQILTSSIVWTSVFTAQKRLKTQS